MILALEHLRRALRPDCMTFAADTATEPAAGSGRLNPRGARQRLGVEQAETRVTDRRMVGRIAAGGAV